MRKQMEKYGFTLIELLAVIVILGVLSLIATPFILGVIESARKGAAVNSAYGYVDAIEKSSLQDMIDKSDYQNKKNGTYNAETIKPVKYKGADPKDVCVTIENGEVTAGSFQFGKYVVDYTSGKAVINEDKENAGCGGNSETPEEEPKTPDDLKDDTKIKNGENYYIGANPNNWVLFGRADESDNKSLLMWRIVKIDKVGIKMVYEGIQNGEKVPLEDGRALLNGTMGVAWNSDSSNFWNTSDLKEKLSTWLSRISVLDLEKYVANTTWKVGGIPDLNPTPLRSFLESGGIDSIVNSRTYEGVTSYQSPIGMISPWDYMYTSSNEECSKSYVSAGTSNECSIGSDGALNNFLYKNKYSYWTMNAVSSASNQAWNITNSGIIASRQTNYSIYSVRPVLNLKLDTKFLTGDGTIEHPYIIEDYLANLFVKPELKLNGEKVVVIHEGDTYLDAGATATDAQDGDITSKITVVSNLDNQKLGSYTITYHVQDSDGNKAIPITRTVKVVDKDTPVITLNGENPTEVIIGSTYAEPGYIAMDPNYGDISSAVTIEGTVDTSTLGIYYRTYHVKNQDGLEAVPVERRVIVKASVPVITLNGSSLTLVDVGTPYNEEGATATDSYYGDLTGSITQKYTNYNETSKSWESVSNIDSNVAGSYKVRYTVTNQFGANAYVDRVVQVVKAAGPTITYTPDSDATSKKGHSAVINIAKKEHEINTSTQKYFTVNSLTGFTSPGTLAGFESMFKTSYQNGSTLSISKGTGKYYFYAIAKDIYQDTTYQKSGLFQMDYSAPVITLNSGVSKVLLGRTYTDPGATAYDQYFDGDLTSKITTQNKVDTSKEGTYQVIYKVSDSAGNETTKVRNIIVYHSVPTIGLLGGSKVRVRYGSTYTEPGYTAKDEVDGDITSEVTVTGSVDTSKEGSYTLTYNVKNSSGKETTKERTVEVYIPSPVITLKGETPVKIKVESMYTDAGATATDEIDGDLTSKITTTSNLNMSVEGTYEVIYQVTNNLGKTSTAKRTVIVYSEAPTITLKGDSPTILYKGEAYKEAGYTASDEVDGDLTAKVTVSGSVDTTKAGTYTITYEVSNRYGKKTIVKRSVIVRASNMVLTLKGDSSLTLLRGTPYTEAGYSASDELEGDITSSVTMDLGGLDINKAGTYTITYTATNSGGDTTSAKRTVIIRKPELAVTLKGESSVTLLRGTPYTEAGYSASDELEGNITSSVTMDLGGLDINKAGMYTITYTATNSGGDTTSVKRTVIIRKPELVVTLNGDTKVELLKGSTYTDLGATATDELDGDITSQITINLNGLNTNLPGTYKVLYLVKNSGGDEVTATRTVVVRNPKVEITLKGNSTVEVPIGYPYSDEGATATDELLGDVSSWITITHNINTNVLGTYQVTYKVVSSGVTATKVRSVKVTPLAGPLVTFETNGNGTYQTENSTKVTVTKNNYDVVSESLSYLWTTNLAKPSEASFKEHFTNGETLKTPENATGKYYLWILAKDTYGNTTIVPSNSFNLDNTAPVLTLIGKKLVEVPADGEYKDQGVSVLERDSGLNEDGVVVTSNVISGVIGTYQVIYTATDKAGNVAVPVKRTVSIIEASLKDAPGEGYVKKYDTSYFVGENPNNYVVFGNAAENNYDYIPIYWRIVKADDTGIKIVYEGIKEGTSIKQNGTIGTYSYDSVSNNFNRPADITTVLNNFYTNLKDEDKDTLTKAINWCVNATPSPYNIDAFRAEECKTLSTNKSVVGLLSGLDYLFTTEAACDAYNQASCGSQNFLKKNYNYFTMSSDSSSSVSEFLVNSNGALTRAEVTTKENIRPVINLRPDVLIKGGEGTLEKPYQLNSRVPVSDTAAPTVAFSPNTATGNLDGVEVLVSDDISGVDNESLSFVWTTNTTQPSVDKFTNKFSNGDKILVPEQQSATYYLWILAKDRKGNQSITRSGLYKIDNVPPVITIKGDNPFAQKPGLTYTDAGATAVDAIDGTVTVQTTTNVNPSVEGTYQVVYTAVDKTGNKATAIRTVIIGYLEIKTPEDFYNIRNTPKGDYIIKNDINFTASQWKDNFPVITDFYGTLDGNGKKLIGLKISGNGIFTNLYSGATIKDIELVGFINSASSTDNVGSITGSLTQTNVTLTGIAIDSTSNINGRSYVGGIIGLGTTMKLTNSYNNSSVIGTSYVGGLTGKLDSTGSITNCYSNGIITGTGNYVGGLVGWSNRGPISKSYFAGEVTGSTYVGGIVGFNDAYITDTYVVGSVTGTSTNSIGGLIGYNNNLTITNGYVLGKLKNAQAIVGTMYSGTFKNTYWISETTGVTSGNYGKMISSLGEAAKGSNYPGFDFTNVWGIEDGSTTPYLKGLMISEKNYFDNLSPYKGEGRGTAEDPYLIKTAENFNNIRMSPNSYYKVMNDIDFTASQWKDNFPVITDFYGTLDGNGKKLIGLKISGNGIFTNLYSGATIKDIELVGFINNASSTDNVGSITGSLTQTNVTLTGIAIDSTSNINGRSYVGGIIGLGTTMKLTNSYNNGSVNGTSYVGGLTGKLDSTGSITNCYSNGIITGTGNYVGGLVGWSNRGPINKSYFAGEVTGSTYVGGIVGFNDAYITDTYVVGSVTGTSTNSIGGLIGYNNNLTITNGYVLGKLKNAQAIVGTMYSGTFKNTYWISETTGVTSGNYGKMISSLGEAAKGSNYPGFDFTNVWGIEDGSTTPYLKGLMISEKNYFDNLSPYKGEGRGTAEDPYLIKTAENFNNIRMSPNSYYKIANDIDFTASQWKDNFPVITDFYGTLDGNGKKLIGLKISGNGIFTNLYSGATIKDIGLVGFINSASSIDNVGSITGSLTQTNVTLTGIAIDSTSNINGRSYVGGIIGLGTTMKLTNSYNNGSVTGTSYVGGLTGQLGSTGSIANSYSNGIIVGTGNYVGGLVGQSNQGPINKSYFAGEVTGSTCVGGIVGYNNSNITDTYVVGSVTGTSSTSVGGLIGYNNNLTITNGYVLGKLKNAQAIVGTMYSGTFKNTYWISETTGVTSGNYGKMISSLGEAAKGSNYTGFDFTNVWGIEDGKTTPYLKGLMISEKNYFDNLSPYKGEGRGTAEDPYLIKTAENFNNIRMSPNSYYKIVNDIDFTTSQWKDNFPVITDFYGTLDGNGKKLIGLKISGNGIFTNLYSGSVIRDIELVGFENIATNVSNVGSITGNLTQTNVTLTGIAIDSTSRIEGLDNVGGILGVGRTFTIINTSNNGSVTGSNQVGGLVGNMGQLGNIQKSYVGSVVKGVSNVGGIVGKSDPSGGSSGTISRLYFSGTVTGTKDSIGGIIGFNVISTIQDVFVAGNVIGGTGNSGGIVGYVQYVRITNAYVSGKINNAAAIIGYRVQDNPTNVYWIGETTGVLSSNYGKMISSLGQATLKSNYSGFNFTSIWGIEEGQTTPYLSELQIPNQVYIGG